jgi:hypothetical protein
MNEQESAHSACEVVVSRVVGGVPVGLAATAVTGSVHLHAKCTAKIKTFGGSKLLSNKEISLCHHL